jgi:predicted amidohydrolase YtcJ
VKHFTNARCYALDAASGRYAVASSLSIDGSRIVALGAEAGPGVERVDLGGATVVPAFADAHVHLDGTGMRSGPHDLSEARDAAGFARLVAALPRGPRVFGAGYDDAIWPDGEANASPLEQVRSDARAILIRVDGHSSLVNRATLAWLDFDSAIDGVERDPAGVPTGRLTLEANRRAQARFLADLSTGERQSALRSACRSALQHGIVHLHAQLMGLGPAQAYGAEIAFLRSLPGVRVYPKICERDPHLAASLGLAFVGGDVFLDGSLGSGTAALRAPYHDRPGCGSLTLSDDDVYAYFAEAERLNVSAGVHAIGDRAIEQALRAIGATRRAGRPATTRHFIEHAELADDEHLRRCARLGVALSMQPQFAAAWGGAGGMYERRLGAQRAAGMNRLRSALRAGVAVAGGSDSPVCRMNALHGMHAAVQQQAAAERLGPLEALTLYTAGAAQLAGCEAHSGRLAPGYDADFTILDRDPFGDGSFLQTRVLATWSGGIQAWPPRS